MDNQNSKSLFLKFETKIHSTLPIQKVCPFKKCAHSKRVSIQLCPFKKFQAMNFSVVLSHCELNNKHYEQFHYEDHQRKTKRREDPEDPTLPIQTVSGDEL